MLDLPLGGEPRLVLAHGAIATSTFPADYEGEHHNNFWVLNLVDGEGELDFDGSIIRYAAGWALFLPPGTAHVWRNRKVVPFIHAHFHASGDPVRMPLAQDLGARAGACRSLLLDAARRVSIEPERVRVALWHLLWELSAAPLQPAAPAHHPLVRELLGHLVTADGSMPDPADLVRRVGVSGRHLNRLWVAAFGMPLGAWLRRNRLRRAQQLLADTTWPVARIAAATGFADLQHFNKAMRAFAGRSPRRLR